MWGAHFQRRPPQALEILLAKLCEIMTRAFGGEAAKNVNVYSFAPWLMTPEQRKEAERAQLVLASKNAAAAHKAKREAEAERVSAEEETEDATTEAECREP